MDQFELAWAAGFFDGEGWANAVAESARRTRRPHARINQAGQSGVPEVLLRFQRAVGGLGRVRGPFVNESRKDLYWWEISSRGDVETVHHLLLPWLSQAKLTEFGSALDRTAARARTVDPSQSWFPWCAGLFDGEGWASMWAHRSHVGYLSAELGVGQSSANGIPEVLDRFRAVMGRGRIYGPYAQAGATMSVYRFKACSVSDVESVAAKLRPWLDHVKRDDVDLVLEILRAQPALPRGNPAWGNRKTHCVNGHEYANARIRPFVARGGGSPPRDSEQCLQCAREQAKARREQKRRSATDDGGRSIPTRASITC